MAKIEKWCHIKFPVYTTLHWNTDTCFWLGLRIIYRAGCFSRYSQIQCRGHCTKLYRRCPRRKDKTARKQQDFTLPNKHEMLPDECWQHFLWSVETKINLFGSDTVQHVWLAGPGQDNHSVYIAVTVKHGGNSVLTGSCMSANLYDLYLCRWWMQVFKTNTDSKFQEGFCEEKHRRVCKEEKSETYYLHLLTVIQQNILGTFYSVKRQHNKPPPANTSWKE